MNMMMKQSSRNATRTGRVGPGGSGCPCCSYGRKMTKQDRRRIRAAEKRAWKRGE